MKATIQDIETLVNETNAIIANTGFSIKAAFNNLCIKLEKFENVYFQFDEEEQETMPICGEEGFNFTLETSCCDLEFTIFQMYEDSKRLSLEY